MANALISIGDWYDYILIGVFWNVRKLRPPMTQDKSGLNSEVVLMLKQMALMYNFKWSQC